MDRRRAAPRRAAGTQISAIIALFILISLFCSDCSSYILKHRLPAPIIQDNPEFVDLYWEAWQLIQHTKQHGKRFNKFPKRYLNPADNGVVDQWSTLSMALFAIPGSQIFPVMPTLDLFYEKQRSDGFIARAYIDNSGDALHLPTQQDPMIHPPLYAWVELQYYQWTADTLRLKQVFPILEKYFQWVDIFCRGKYEAEDLYYNTPIGSGMLNLPRGNIESGGWSDMSAQMALFADQLSRIAAIIGNDEKCRYYTRKYHEIGSAIQAKLWNPDSLFYFDINREGRQSKMYTIAGFWPLLAKIPNPEDARQLISHLKDSSAFGLQHMFPSVSIRESEYNPKGFYWRGGVWGITNYMVIQGLLRYGERDFARRAALNHLRNMSLVYHEFGSEQDPDLPEDTQKIRHSIWELYAPEEEEPGTCWDATNYGAPDHITFSGYGPILLFIQNILGFDVDAPHDELNWRINRQDQHGIQQLSFGDNCITVWTDPRKPGSGSLAIHGNTDSDVRINFFVEADTFSVAFDPGPLELSFFAEDYIIRGRFNR
jgi:hypothetical protein